VNDRIGDIGVAVWIVLRRAHHSGVTNLAGQWRDCGRPVPGSVADALDRLTSSGQLALAVADPESCGARRVTVTDTGCARYVTLCQVHNSPDSGWPPAETAPGGQPDTTMPVESASATGDAAGDALQRGMLGAGQVVINPGVHRGTPCPTCLPVIDSPEAAGRALGELFLANANRGNDAANDDLVAEVVRRIRAQQDSRDGGRGQRSPSQPAATAQASAPQFGNSPDSGRPLVEQFPRPIPAPGGRPNTTAPVAWTRLAADADERDHPPGGREQPRLGLRPGVVIDCCVQLPVTSIDPVTGSSPELVAALVLHRAHGSGVAKLGADYLDHGLPTPGSLAGVFDELRDTGLLALAGPGPEGLRRVTLITVGHTRCEQLPGTPRPLCLPVSAPQFPIQTPADRRLSSPTPLPAPDGEPDPSPRAGGRAVGRCGGRAAPMTGACTCCSPPRSLLPPPGATPTRSAGAPFRRKVSPSPTAARGRCA